MSNSGADAADASEFMVLRLGDVILPHDLQHHQPTNQTTNQPTDQPTNQLGKQTNKQTSKQTDNQINKQASQQASNKKQKQTHEQTIQVNSSGFGVKSVPNRGDSSVLWLSPRRCQLSFQVFSFVWSSPNPKS